MKRMNAIIRQMHLLNIILLVILILLVAKIAYLSFVPRSDNGESPEKTQVSKIPEGMEKQAIDSPVSLLTDYTVVTENNLFHPSRTVLESGAQTIEAASRAVPEFVLYGTLITSEFSMAYLEDLKAPVVSSSGRKKQISLKKGEILSGYTLKDVAEDRVTMADDVDEITVYLTAEKNRQQVPASVQKTKAKTTSTPMTAQQAPVTTTKKPQFKDKPIKESVEKKTTDAAQEKASAPGQKLLDFFRRGR